MDSSGALRHIHGDPEDGQAYLEHLKHPVTSAGKLAGTAADIVYLTNIEHDTAIKIICAKARYSDTFERVYQFDKCSGKIGELIKL